MRATPLSRIISRSTRATLITILMVVNVLAAIATIISAYGGIIDPDLSIFPALMSMMLPGILIGDLLLVALDLIVRKWSMTFIIAISWLVSLPPLLTYAPMNIGNHELTPEEKERSFTLLTYNALHFWDFRGNVPGLESNSTIDYILETDADIVNLQEVEFIKTWPLWHITSDQISRLNARYPYRMVDINNQLTILSKYPFNYDDIPLPSPMDVRMALFRFNIQGHRVNLFNVHLESIGLSMADKALYQNLFDKAPGSERAIRKELSDVKHQLISKLAVAFRKRADQARFIRHTIDSIGGNFIVAGDFNDIQGCYAVRTIMDGDMKDAYAENAFGPTITYHGNRFYFRIDQVLYKGDMKAVDIERGDIESSDHYPLLTTFVFDGNSP
ncbi:endonuclease/exonuclease/phosphatase family protein [uncultured Duncaniella sp.]|uniref:endonuclease/exonuclease/phosphatase family protein n=1 Tax=uncultured Duncaniella sp. TaxID=2768039 RepID=UPI002675F630|nr:endonuclease/exonuclease/phosphatase family protein [uncultured Duncaniella sp.]MCI9172057.1 hypothetical protein [Muribaculaceae bacterium]